MGNVLLLPEIHKGINNQLTINQIADNVVSIKTDMTEL